MTSVARRLLLPALLLFCPAAIAQDPTKDTAGYFPLKEGAVWTYRTNNGSEYKTKVESVKKEDGDVVAKLVTRGTKGLISTEQVKVQKDGVFRIEFSGKKVDPPVQLLKFPFKNNETWKFDAEVGKQPIKGGFTVTEAKGIKVGDKTYDTIKVESKDVKVDEQGTTITYYFARDVGLVKQTIVIGNTTVEVELVEYKEK